MKQILEKTDIIENLVPQFKDAKSIFLMGKGSATESITKEGALKLKEISYIHAEGYSSSSLKHGTFALIEKNLPIIILDIDEDHRDKNRNAYQEIKARDAFIIRISDLNDSECELFIPRNKTYGGLLANTYLQLLSYYTALSKGINPDYPKNLAKVVTVE
jgi:glucosamine--fructose-6-phosphate aminotransferase (isomerizing)